MGSEAILNADNVFLKNSYELFTPKLEVLGNPETPL